MRWDIENTPGRFTPGKKTRYPLYRRLGGLQRRSEWVWKISPPPLFVPRTVHPLSSRYNDWAIPAHKIKLTMVINVKCYIFDYPCQLVGKQHLKFLWPPNVIFAEYRSCWGLPDLAGYNSKYTTTMATFISCFLQEIKKGGCLKNTWYH
jgi:hypothetical protein